MTPLSTLDEVAAVLLPGQPDSYHRLAEQFDAMGDELDELARRLSGHLDVLDEAWSRVGAEDHSLGLYALMRLVRPREFSPLLREMGDRLAAAQAQVRDLQLQRAQTDPTAGSTNYDQQADLVLRDVSYSFAKLGQQLPALPEHTAMGNEVEVSNVSPPPSSLIPVEVPMAEMRSTRTDVLVPVDSTADGVVGRATSALMASAAPFHAVLPGEADSPSAPDLRSAAAASADHSASGAGGGGPMPMMPMGGMGMGGGGGPTQQRERRGAAMASPGSEAWEEPVGWGVLGRGQAGDQPVATPVEIVLPDGSRIRTDHR